MNFIRRMPDGMRTLAQSFLAKLMLTLLLPLLIVGGLVAFASTSMLQRQQDFFGQQQHSDAKLHADELNEKIKDRLTVLIIQRGFRRTRRRIRQ